MKEGSNNANANKDDKKQQPQGQSQAVAHLNVRDTPQYKDLELKLDNMKIQHNIEKKMCSKLAMDYSVNYFKNKSNEIGQLYTVETVKLLSQYN